MRKGSISIDIDQADEWLIALSLLTRPSIYCKTYILLPTSLWSAWDSCFCEQAPFWSIETVCLLS